MTRDDWFGIAILLGILAVAILGGSKNFHPLFTPAPLSPEQQQAQKQTQIEQQINQTQIQVTNLQQQLQAQEDAKSHSPYYGVVNIQWVSHSNSAANEYLSLSESSSATTTVDITGWTIQSKASGVTVEIPQGTYLIFPDNLNSKDDIIFTPGDNAYVITGITPNGYNFKLNKCSGYWTQFQNFTPSFYTSCPRPAQEDLSSIPKRVENNACFDYIDSFPTCRVQTDPLPNTFSAECQQFITQKINYGTCVNVHKSDSDFYLHQWYIYLGRGTPLWLNEREDIVLLDNNGKVVSELKY